MLVLKGCLVKILSHIIGDKFLMNVAPSTMVNEFFYFLLHNSGLIKPKIMIKSF